MFCNLTKLFKIILFALIKKLDCKPEQGYNIDFASLTIIILSPGTSHLIYLDFSFTKTTLLSLHL